MAHREVKLIPDAREKALEFGVAVGFLQDEESFKRNVVDGWATVRGRDFALLREHGLIEEDATRLLSPAADQPEAEKAADSTRTHAANKRDRGPSGTSRSPHPGGTGHQPGDGYGPKRIHDEIAARGEGPEPPKSKAKAEDNSKTASKGKE